MLIEAGKIVTNAYEDRCAVGAFTIYNLEWAKWILTAAQRVKAPVILSVSEAAAGHMGGFSVASAMVRALIDSMGITVPVALHLDHGGFEAACQCMDAGFTSVMFDGSRYPLAENLDKTAWLVQEAHKRGISVEAEVGAIAGTEDGRSNARGEIADPRVCAEMANTGVDFLAAGIGNIHGAYPADWRGLDFDALDAIRKAVGETPLVLHGGSGIPGPQIQKAISMGVAKIDVNTECQIAWADGLRDTLQADDRLHDPRKLMLQAGENICDAALGKMQLFGSAGLV